MTTEKEQTTEIQEKQWQKGDDNQWKEVEVTVSKSEKVTKSLEPIVYVQVLKKMARCQNRNLNL